MATASTENTAESARAGKGCPREHMEFGRSLAQEELMQEVLSFMDNESAREKQERQSQRIAGSARNKVQVVADSCRAQPAVTATYAPLSMPPIAAAAAGATRPSLPLPRKRASLDEDAVVKIFLANKISKSPEETHAGPGLRCSLARHYGVTEKAVRDIWTGRTWKRITAPYWNVA